MMRTFNVGLLAFLFGLFSVFTSGTASADNDCKVDKSRNNAADLQVVFKNDSSAEINVSLAADRQYDDGNDAPKSVYEKTIKAGTKAFTNRSVGGAATNDYTATFSSPTDLFKPEEYTFAIRNSKTVSSTRVTFYKERTQPPKSGTMITCKRFYNQKSSGKSRWEIRYTVVDN